MNNNYTLAPINSTETTTHYIAFTLKDKQYAINIKYVLEIINIPTIEISQCAPIGVAGIFNYKGLMANVVDICPLVGEQPSNFNINNQLIVICVEGHCIAIHSETINNIMNIEESALQPLPYQMNNSLITNIYKSDIGTIHILNIETLNNIISQKAETINPIDYMQLYPQDEKSTQVLNFRNEQNQKKKEIFSFSFNLNSSNQYILFKLENNNYYIDLKYIKEFTSIKRLNITKLPYTPCFIKGITNIKGNFIVVVDLKKFLNENDTSETNNSKLMIVEGKNYNIALLVDEIKYIENLKDIKQTSVNDEHSKYLYSEFIENDVLYSILNIEKIVNDERLCINIE